MTARRDELVLWVGRDFIFKTMSKGWIQLHRKLMDSDELWLEKRIFSEWEAWIYLLMKANHTIKTIYTSSGKSLTVDRGEHITSTVKLASVFGWSRSRVGRFLTKLSNGHKITSKSNSKWTQIRIKNYDKYQSLTNDTEQQLDTTWTEKISTADTNNNDLLNNKLNKYPLPPSLRNGLCVDALESWIEHRKQIKKKVTESIIKGLGKKYDNRPIDFVRDIEHSISNGWQGVFAADKTTTAKKTNTQQTFDLVAQIMAEEE